MSRILRRPMFRGGSVSSYGTGIASGLADGGMPPKRGLVTGPGGYAGKFASGWNRIWGNPTVATTGGNITTGGQIVEQASKPLESQIAKGIRGAGRWLRKPNTGITGWAMRNFPTALRTGAYGAPVWAALQGSEAQAELIDKASDKGMLDKFGENVEFVDGRILPSYEFAETVDPSEYTFETGLLKTDEEKEKEADEAEKVRLKAMKAMTTDDAYTEREVNTETAEPVKLTAKEMVAENKELFRDLLGYKKAKGQDISEMLLGFAGAEGDTVWDKSKAFFRDEAKRPGKAQKIDETAAALAINDYIAGKRSLEQIEKLKGIETFKLDEQLKRLYPQADDDWLTAVRKAAGKDDSYSSSKVLKKAIAGKFGNVNINPDISKKNLEEIKKDQEDFEIGFTIVTLTDKANRGKKVIIEKTETDILVRTDLPVF